MFAKLIGQNRPLLADGATGTNLYEVGLAAGDCPEFWNETHPERIRALHQAFLDAGADIILTNSFGANRRRLAMHDLQGRVRDLAERAARLARFVADSAGRPVAVGGSVGPTGDLLAPIGELSEDDAFAIFSGEIEGLKQGGVDVIWIETMSSVEESRAAARAAAALSMPYTVTATFDTAGRTMMGLAPAAFARAFDDLAAPPLAIGANCGVGAADLLVSVLAITEAKPDAAVIAKANAGAPQRHGDHIHYAGSPELMGLYAALAVDAGARIVGGCCGNTLGHVAAMRRALDAYKPGPRPDLEAIVAALGPLVSPPAPEGGARRRRRPREDA